MNFDRVVISSDRNPKYLEFWPLVSWAWKALTGVQPELALIDGPDMHISDLNFGRALDGPGHKVDSYEWACRYGPVFRFPQVEGVPDANNAKMARHVLASFYRGVGGTDTCLISDIDLLPLSRDYLMQITGRFRAGGLLVVGSEVYDRSADQGKWPMQYTTAVPSLFQKILGIDMQREWPSQFYPEILRSWIGHKLCDHKEDVAIDIPSENPDTFADESLLRALVMRWCGMKPEQAKERIPFDEHRGGPVQYIGRGFDPYTDRGLDRFDWKLDPDKLDAGEYVEAHLPRPLSAHMDKVLPLIDHIRRVTGAAMPSLLR